MDEKPESEEKAKVKRVDLSVAQVAGSALAAVIAALLAGKLGVYGTVAGAGVVSIVATTGGTFFHHLFRRTGEQLRDATGAQSAAKLRKVPVGAAGRAVDRARRAQPGAHAGAYPGAHEQARFDDSPAAFSGYSDAYSTGTVHGTRLRGWKRSLLAAGAVFVLAMGTVTAVELASGSSADGDKGGTTVSRLFRPDSGGGQDEQHDPSHDRTPDGNTTPGDEDDSGSTPSPGASQPGDGTGKQSPGPSQSPSGGSTSTPTPGPSTSPDSGKGDDGKGGGTGQSSSPQPGQSPSGQGGQGGRNAAAGGTGTGPSAGTAS
ncbi:hypothetical protein [Streptomyces sp. NPDC049555]|uniref:hypothetical protein n=1 Tax=Streptomyces sp. NPDC049555 TaxID=3154930 RepID=UPI00341F9DB2